MDRDSHYKRYRETIAQVMTQTRGYYDSKPGKPLRHSVWQRRVRRIAMQLITKALDRIPGNLTGLDVGCGMGDFTIQIARQFPKIIEMVGCDITEEALEIARNEAASLNGISFKSGDILTLPFENNQFDLTLCINILHHVCHDDQGKALTELARVTKKYLVLEIKNQNNFYYKYFHRKVRGLDVFPTRSAEVGQTLGRHGFQLRRSRGIFTIKVLSPIIVLLFEKNSLLAVS